ncbi:MAG: cyclic nucleotide-binding domain-containing protein [candidate division Zixibacteria bacterium]|nr:cyclic nucleotide-binding domain-containing protein [candidate division Zixibacteria bacterium]
MKLSDYERPFSASVVIYRQGESPDSLFLLEKGKVTLSKVRGGKRSLQKIVTEGSFFGLEEFLLGTPREEEAAAALDSVVLELPRHLAESYLLSNPKFLYELCEYLARKSRGLERAFFLAGRSEGARLSATLWLVLQSGGNGPSALPADEVLEVLFSSSGLPPDKIADFLAELERLEIVGKTEDQKLFLKSAEKLFRYAEYLEDKEHFG